MKKKLLAFTLIEILVVCTIIGILMVTGVTAYNMMGKSSRDARRKADLEQIRSALEMYRSNDTNSAYPATLGLLSSGTPKYLETSITDPKTNAPYQYDSSGTDYTLSTQLEIGNPTCTGSGCSLATNCYCLGPYGKK